MSMVRVSDFAKLFNGMQFQTASDSSSYWQADCGVAVSLLAGWHLGATCFASALSSGVCGF